MKTIKILAVLCLTKLCACSFIFQVFINIENEKPLHNLSVCSFCCQFIPSSGAGSAVGVWHEDIKMWLNPASEPALKCVVCKLVIASQK